MEALCKIIKKFNSFLCHLGAFPLAFVALITFADVIGRYFKFPIPGTLELGQLLMVSVIYLALGHTQAQKGHIFLDLSIPFPLRIQKIVDTLVIFIGLFVMGVLTWKSIPFIFAAYRNNEWSDYLHIPIFLFKAFLFIGTLTFCFQLIIDLFELWNKGQPIKDEGVSE